MLGERGRKLLDSLRPDREPGGGSVAAEALQQARARVQSAMQVERRDRTARALPLLLAGSDQDDWALVALDQARGDDSDDALVPLLAPKDVGAATAQLVGPLLHL